MKPRLAVLAIVLALSACAQKRTAAALDSQIGQPVANIAERLGPPTSTIPTGQGRALFQWQHYGSYQTTGTATVVGGVLITNPSQVRQTQCILSVEATTSAKNPTLGDWIITRWRASGTGCY
jgi:hypothetical protein